MSIVEIGASLVAGMAASVVGGGISGLVVGYKKIDTILAGMMGMFYGALASIGMMAALVLLSLLT